MLYSDLFAWWVICISWSAVFLTAVSVYLYVDSRKRKGHVGGARSSPVGVIEDFVFVWVLLGLLNLYIVSINRGSSILFAAGNIVVEVILIAYARKNKLLTPS
jgi:uncharacterized membrane protein